MAIGRIWTASVVATFLVLVPGAQATDDSGSTSVGIKGGKETKMCEWATTTWLRNCTATLIHPRVVIYAAHCGKRISSIFFGEHSRSKGSISPKVKFCKTNPGYKGSHSLGKGEDYAFCLLEEPMNEIPIAPIGYGCELEHVNPENPVWLVGFGLNDNKEGKPKSGVKRMVKTNIGRKSEDGTELELGRLGFVSSSGDSGGPAYVKLKDGTWRVVGITSWGAGPGPNWYVSAAHAVPWIHKVLKQEGYDDIDITPCYEDDGTWAPSKDCGGFALDPGTAYGTYEEQCSVNAPLSGPSSICGEANPNAKGGVAAPKPSIESPKVGEKIEKGGTLEVRAKISDPPEGHELKATLYVSGKAQKSLSEAPYVWSLDSLEVGSHELLVKAALSKGGGVAQSETIQIEVLGSDGSAGESDSSESKGDKGEDSDESSDSGTDPSEKSSGGEERDRSGQGEDSSTHKGSGAAQEDKDGRKGCDLSGNGQPSSKLWFLAVLAALGRCRRRD